VAACLFNLPAQARYSGGSGTADDPYQIATAADLITLGETPTDYAKHFVLAADIDLSPNLPGRKVFDKGVIGLLTGVFDGAGHTISNFAQASVDTDYAGLFACVNGTEAEVKNLGLIAPHVETATAWNVGALVGRLDKGTITNCYVQDGNVSGRSFRRGQEDTIYGGLSYAGGLVGISNGAVIDCRAACTVFGSSRAGGLAGISIGTVIHCTSSGDVSGNMSVGGLVGWNGPNGEITRSSATGNVSAKGAYAGGLVGENMARIINSYARGSVAGNSIVGGLAGSNGHIQTWDVYSETPGEIINSYSTGAVSGVSDVGGLVGLHEIGPVASSFWDIQTSGQAASAVGIGKTTTQMQTAATFSNAGRDFVGETKNGTEDVWWIDEGKDYPRLWWEALPK
jgi:hypothetical protein